MSTFQFTLHYTVYSINNGSIQYTVYSAIYSIQYRLYSAIYSIQYGLYSAIYSIQYGLNSAIYSIQYKLYSAIYRKQYRLYSAIYSIQWQYWQLRQVLAKLVLYRAACIYTVLCYIWLISARAENDS